MKPDLVLIAACFGFLVFLFQGPIWSTFFNVVAKHKQLPFTRILLHGILDIYIIVWTIRFINGSILLDEWKGNACYTSEV